MFRTGRIFAVSWRQAAEEVNRIRMQASGVFTVVGCQRPRDGNDIARRKGPGNHDHACMGEGLLGELHGETHEVVTIAGDETTSFIRSQPELLWIEQPVATAFMGANRVDTQSAGDDGNFV